MGFGARQTGFMSWLIAVRAELDKVIGFPQGSY